MSTWGRILATLDEPVLRASEPNGLAAVQRRVACGCHLARATSAAIAGAGLSGTAEHLPKAGSLRQRLADGTAQR